MPDSLSLELEWDLPGLNTPPSRRLPTLFFCSDRPPFIIVAPAPLQPRQAVNCMTVVVFAHSLASIDSTIPSEKPVIASGILAKDVGGDVGKLETRPDVRNPDERVGNQPCVSFNSSQVVVNSNANVFLRSQPLIEYEVRNSALGNM